MAKKKEFDAGLVGRTIVAVGGMTDEEMAAEGWEGGDRPIALVLDDGTVIYPSRDPEGNAPGYLFGRGKDGTSFLVI